MPGLTWEYCFHASSASGASLSDVNIALRVPVHIASMIDETIRSIVLAHGPKIWMGLQGSKAVASKKEDPRLRASCCMLQQADATLLQSAAHRALHEV